ncbi:MAG TPA: amidase [Rectinemataceae bacterium]|nr:amidase [Rectinemataceae bacterium]
MKELSIPDLVDRLRASLRGAGIAAAEEDIGAIAERGFLNGILAFEAAVKASDPADRPDFGPSPGSGYLAPAAPEGDFAREATAADASRAGEAQTGAFGSDGSGPGIVATLGRLRRGELSSYDIVKASLARIEERNGLLNAFTEVRNEAALVEARKADEELRSGSGKAPLQGIPIAVKDIFDVAGMATRAGTSILGSTAALRDSAAVAALRRAGAIIIGKTSLPEFSFSPGSNNDHYGPTRNPHNTERDTGGSSAGSAAAVADAMVLGALGSDSGGSIRIPASFCGLVGWKPAWAWSSLEGAIGLSWSLDTVGVLTMRVEDAMLMGSALGHRPFASFPKTGPGRSPSRALEGLRLGAIRGEGRGRAAADADVLGAWDAGLDLLRQAGALVVDLEMDELPLLRAVNSAILAIEAAALHRNLQVTRLSEYGDFARLGLLAGWAYGPADYLRARQALGALRRRMLARFDTIDLLCSPTMTSEATALGKPPKITFTAPFNALGWPALSLPCGRGATGLPVGLQLVGRPGDEALIFGAAAELEARLAGH